MRVLLIEDEESMAASLRRGLEAEGYIVEHARDGEDGLWRATEFDFDAVVLDIMIPKMNGFAVTSNLRAAGRTVPILMLTAKVGEFDQTEALDSGADDFLSKPFSYPVLLARLRALIRRGSTSTTSVIQLGDLSVDLAGRTCQRGDTEIVLTAKEFQLLAYLALHAGTVVAKTTLLQHVWHEGPDMETNIVEVYIGYLRRKIDTPFGRQSIETIRGHGYRIEADGG
jgi:two-component system OmpR family response regulator